jgi:hypothetical protein
MKLFLEIMICGGALIALAAIVEVFSIVKARFIRVYLRGE